ncbi:hypothetical protein [Pasteurella multocida]|uniref:hypothetical protein n=1 Tax=Pasteurella multocida TaxID=747 RepID=UPI0011C0787A|nr:hypothetical protein [Pasteurella multocida]HDR1012133.1 hypothetical protein [Pasteurella multocida]HDR1235250.1 hypothetical protein [Pasteurella multocida]HEA3287605.1 hypothetical protein [Pasteurella multocida]HEA3289664.1 hypothetical protein [Pasteurella multocida]HEA3290714.1 hypothetical protein [Pasteurella multocida]
MVILTFIIAIVNYNYYNIYKNREILNILENKVISLENLYNFEIKESIILKDLLYNENNEINYCNQNNKENKNDCIYKFYIRDFILPFREHIADTKSYDSVKMRNNLTEIYLNLKRLELLIDEMPENFSESLDRFIKNFYAYLRDYQSLRLYLIMLCPNYSLDETGKRNIDECTNKIYEDQKLKNSRYYSDRFILSAKDAFNSYEEIIGILYTQFKKF